MQKQIIFKNKLDEVAKIEGFVEEIGEELNLSPAIIGSINLALEEAVDNVIMYAYPTSETNEIRLYATTEGEELTFLLTDSGVPFDPTDVKAPDLSLPAEERPIGGLGIMLIKKIMNEVSYQHIDGTNRLTMKKKLSE